LNSSQAKALIVVFVCFVLLVSSAVAYGVMRGSEHGVTTSILVGLSIVGVVGVFIGLALFFAFSELVPFEATAPNP